MEFNQSIYYMEKRGNLKGFSDEQKEEFIKACNANFFFYDPYKDLLINPITSKKYWPKSLQRAFNYSNNSLEEKLSSKFPTKVQVDGSLDKLYSRNERAYILHYKIIRNLKYLGLILGGVLSYFIDFNLGLAVGLYLIYFDYNTFDKVNGVIDQIQSGFMTAMIWQKKRNLYFFGSLLLLLGSLVSLYLFTNSIYIVIGVFFAQKFILVNPTVQFIASAGYRGTEVAIKLEEEFEKQSKKNDFLDAFPKGIKIKEVEFYDDTLCEYEEVEELKIFYETPEDQYCSKHLFVYSKEPIKKENLDRVIMSDGVAKQLLRLDNDDRVEFYFEHIPNKPKTTYFVIAKEDFMSIHEFEGTNSRCIVKSFHDNGKIDSYQEYEDGIMHGKMIEFHNNGQEHLECDFENGLLLPSYYEWKYADGKTMMSGSLRKLDNRNPEQKDLYDPNSEFRIGKWEIFEEDGSLIKSVDYKPDGERQTIKEDKEKSKNLIWL
jgi:antitoxin component YwqK of YwqJK toxin-antitoxin module